MKFSFCINDKDRKALKQNTLICLVQARICQRINGNVSVGIELKLLFQLVPIFSTLFRLLAVFYGNLREKCFRKIAAPNQDAWLTPVFYTRRILICYPNFRFF